MITEYYEIVVGLTFCSFRYFTDLKAPKNMGNIAIITKLKYAIATPSILAGGLSVTFLTVSLTASSMFIGSSVAESAISYELFAEMRGEMAFVLRTKFDKKMTSVQLDLSSWPTGI